MRDKELDRAFGDTPPAFTGRINQTLAQLEDKPRRIPRLRTALIVAAVVVALFAVIGIICGVSAKKRRLREQRLRVSSGRSYGVSPDVAGARRTTYGHGAPASGKRAAAPKGSGRHMRQ